LHVNLLLQTLYLLVYSHLKEHHFSDNGILQALSAKLVGQYALVATENYQGVGGTVSRGTDLHLLTDVQLVPDDCSTILSYPPFCGQLQTPQRFQKKCQRSRNKRFPAIYTQQDSFNTSTPKNLSSSLSLCQLHSLDDSFVSGVQALDQQLCPSSQRLEDHASVFRDLNSTTLQNTHSDHRESLLSSEHSWQHWCDVPNPSFLYREDSAISNFHCLTETTSAGNETCCTDKSIQLVSEICENRQSCGFSLPSCQQKTTLYKTCSFCSTNSVCDASKSNCFSTPIIKHHNKSNMLCPSLNPSCTCVDTPKWLKTSEPFDNWSGISEDRTESTGGDHATATSTSVLWEEPRGSEEQTSTATYHSVNQTSTRSYHSVDQTSTGTYHSVGCTPELFIDKHTNGSNSPELFSELSTPIDSRHLQPGTMMQYTDCTAMTPELF